MRSHPLSVMLDKYVRGVLYARIVEFSVLRVFKIRKRKIITILSHTFNGNARSFALWLFENQDEYEVAFAFGDPKLYRKFIKDNHVEGVKILSLQNIRHVFYISKSSVIGTTHGPVFLKHWPAVAPDIDFVDFWHGVGFKGGFSSRVKELKYYRAIFVSSPAFRDKHKKAGFRDDQLFITGYSRTDALVGSSAIINREKILKELNLIDCKDKKIILFAPTWKAGKDGTVKIFNKSLDYLIEKAVPIIEKNNGCLIFRPHINSDVKINVTSKAFKIMSSADYPDVERLLQVTDTLITDWSSIFTDFLVLGNKPVIFLENKLDTDGTGLQVSDRPGEIVDSVESLIEAMRFSLQDSKSFIGKHRNEMDRVVEKAWGTTLDGKSSERYFKAIKEFKNEQI